MEAAQPEFRDITFYDVLALTHITMVMQSYVIKLAPQNMHTDIYIYFY